MIAEFVFTPTESKYLIAKAIAKMDRVQKAFREGILAMHPSSSTYCLMKELTGHGPKGKVWVTGMIVPKGLCVEANTQVGKADKEAGTGLGKSLADPGLYPHTMVIHKGEVVLGWTIYDLMEKMKPGDIYVKGVNAIDINRKVGVLLGSMAEGTIGKMVKAAAEKGFEIMCPVGLEKLLPVSLDEASAFVERKKDYSMGQKCRLKALDGTVITEVDALEMLFDVKAMPFAAGGLAGAEGSVCIAVEGTDEQVKKAIEMCEAIKGAELPEAKQPDCLDCTHPTCHLSGVRKPWVK